MLCSKCKEDFNEDKFIKDRRYKRGRGSYCANCRSQSKLKDKTRSDYRVNYNYIKRYGITKEIYEQMYSQQEGKCYICQSWQPVLCVDHDHKTLQVRSLLCYRCNAGLGQFMDDADYLEAAAQYLRKHNAYN